MKITDIQFEKVKIKLKDPIVVAFATLEYGETILIKVVTDEGIVGFGEAAPFAPVTGELLESTLVVLGEMKKLLIGLDPLAIEHIHAVMDKAFYGNTAAKAGIDIALYDIKGKVLNQPLYKVLGGDSPKVLTDITIGIDTPEKMAALAKEYVAEGYRILKIKAGISPEDDIEAIRQIRAAVGNGIRLRIDANQGWTVNSSIRTMKAMEPFAIDAIEQPLPYWDIEGTAFLRKRIESAVMLDESLHSPKDALHIVRSRAADFMNIKLMKSAGLYPAMKINVIAESAGVNCMVGCMLETKLAITAAASLVAAMNNITEADVDSFKFFNDTTVTGGFEIEGDIITLSEKPGLGIEINM